MIATPWGERRVWDAHVHFFSHSFFTGLARQKKLGTAEELAMILDWQIPPADPQFLARTWEQELKRAGIERACLIASAPGDEQSVATAAGMFPDRFFGYFMLDPTQPDALDRVQAAARNPNLHGICLFPAMHRYSITDPRLIAILEIAADTGMVVFVHCGAISVGVRKKLGLPSPYDLRFSNPMDLHPVALHFPRVNFVIPHFGAGLFREALMVADLCPNVYLDTSSTNRWMLYEGIDLKAVFRRALCVLGPERLLFGTDSSCFPRGWNRRVFDDQMRALAEIDTGRSCVDCILSQNLERLLQRRVIASGPDGRLKQPV